MATENDDKSPSDPSLLAEETLLIMQNSDSQAPTLEYISLNDPSKSFVPVPSEQLKKVPDNADYPLVDAEGTVSFNETVPSASSGLQDTGMLNRRIMNRNSLFIIGALLGSRLLGILRTSLFAYIFGTGHISDAYTQAFLIPDMIFTVIASGALTSVFVPIFLEEKSEGKRRELVSTTLNSVILLLIIAAGLAMLFIRQLVPLYNPGDSSAELDLIASLTRIMLLQSIILGIGTVFTSIIIAHQKMLYYAISLMIYNVGLILGLIAGYIFAIHGQENQVSAAYFASWGVVLGAILQLLVVILPIVSLGIRYSRSLNWRLPEMMRMVHQITPRFFNSGVLYFSTFVDRGLLSSLSVLLVTASLAGLITQYTQAFQLLQFPISIVGGAIGTAAFPTLSAYVADKKFERVRDIVMEILHRIIYISVPCMVGLTILSIPLIQVVLQHGAYTLQDTVSTSVALDWFALGLPALAAVEILTRVFYAMQDTKSPVFISIGQFILKILLSLVLIRLALLGGPTWGMAGLAFSTSFASSLEAIILLSLLQRSLHGLEIRALAGFVLDALLAAVLTGIVLYFLRMGLDALIVTTSVGQTLGLQGTLFAALKLIIEGSAGIFCYIRFGRFLKIQDSQVTTILHRFHLGWI